MNVLGFSIEHDSGVAFLQEGQAIYAANEERFNRKKFTTEIPQQAFVQGKKMFPDITFDLVAVGSKIHIIDGSVSMARNDFFQKIATLLNILGIERFVFATPIGIFAVKAVFAVLQLRHRISLKKMINNEWGVKAPVVFVDHHIAHASTAYFTAPFGSERMLVVTLDGAGDCFCSKVFIGEKGNLRLLHKIPFFHSPGYYYMYVTKLLGFGLGEEGKVMGLAATGDPSKTLPIFQSRITLDERTTSFVNHGSYRLPELKYLEEKLKGFSKEDIAAGIQAHLENLVESYIKILIQKYVGHKIPVALAGGVFANVRLNQRIRELEEVSQVYIFPHMSDGGMAMGAALWARSRRVQQNPRELHDAYLGPAYSEEVTEKALKDANISYAKNEFSAKEVAQYLAQDKIVAVCQGRMEYGPRALGNRTVLAPTVNKEVTGRVNAMLQRNDFMPFAPIIRDIHTEDFFLGLEKSKKAPEFMTITADATEKCKKEAPAIVHVDGTARPQVVTKDINPFIYDVLSEYEALTGLKVLINTSFNMHGEPIVCTPQDAVRSFVKSHIDVLFVNNYISVSKS